MLITTPNLRNPDEAYARLIATHDGLSEAESHACLGSKWFAPPANRSTTINAH